MNTAAALKLRNLYPYLTVWTLAAALAWLTYLALIRVSADGRIEQVFLGSAIVVGLGAGLLAMTVLERRRALSAAEHRLVMLVAGWGVAAAAGWNIAVMVGGPLSGLVTSIFAFRLLEGQAWRQAVVLVTALVAGRIAMELPGGTELFSGGLWCSLAIAVVAPLTLHVLGWSRFSWRLPAAILWWGAAWVFAFWVKNKLGMPAWHGYGTNSLELVVAFGVGGAAVSLPALRMAPVFYWALGGAVAALVGVPIDLALTSLLGGSEAVFSGRPAYLDAGHVIGMALGALCAALLWQARTSGDG
ncbi:MAG: hypothetical protein AAGE85_18390 [Pseudomonadota bacterium]